MYDDFMLNDAYEAETINDLEGRDSNIDNLFNNLTEDIASANKFILEVTKKNKNCELERKELDEDKQKFRKSKEEFELYKQEQQEEIRKKKRDLEQHMTLQLEKIRKAEDDFRNNMSHSLNEIQIEKKELEIAREEFAKEKEQFDAYRALEITRIDQSKREIEDEKEQFNKYKDVSKKRIELENKNIEQKCLKFREIMNQFNSNFKFEEFEDKE